MHLAAIELDPLLLFFNPKLKTQNLKPLLWGGRFWVLGFGLETIFLMSIIGFFILH